MTYEFGLLYGLSSDIVTSQNRELTIQEGDSFKKGDILAYNPDFFEKDPMSRQVDWKHGTSANVAIMDVATTFEDSNVITTELGKRLSINPIQIRSITLDRNTIVHEMVKTGDHVEITDELIVFESGDMVDTSSLGKTDEALDYLSKLNRKIPKAKYAGAITKIEMYVGCDKEDLHPSLQAVYNTLTKKAREIYKLAKDGNNYHNFIPITHVPKGTKIKGDLFTEDTVVIKFYIIEELTAGIGDKLVFDSSLKSIVAETLDYIPVSESGVPIDAIFSGTSISNRIVNSPIIVGMGERILEELEKQIVEDYFDK